MFKPLSLSLLLALVSLSPTLCLSSSELVAISSSSQLVLLLLSMSLYKFFINALKLFRITNNTYLLLLSSLNNIAEMTVANGPVLGKRVKSLPC